MKNLKCLLENKFLIKNNINKEDKFYEVYQNNISKVVLVKINNINDYDLLTKNGSDTTRIKFIREKIEDCIKADKGGTEKRILLITPKKGKLSLDWNWDYINWFNNDYKKIGEITVKDFNENYWEKQHWTRK